MADKMSVSMQLVSGVKTKQPKKNQKSAQDDLLGFGQALMDAHAANQSTTQTRDAKPDTPEREPARDSVKTVQGAEKADTAEAAVQGRIVRQDTAEPANTAAVETAAETDPAQGFLGELFAEAGTEGQTAGIPLEGVQTAGLSSAEPVQETLMQNTAEAEIAPELQETQAIPTAQEARPQHVKAETKVQGAETLTQAAGAQEAAQTVAETEETASEEFDFSGHPKAQASAKKTAETGQNKQEELQTAEEGLFVSDVSVHTASARPEAVHDAGPMEAAEHLTETGEMNLEYADMIKDQIARQIMQGKEAIEISLSPRSLGNLTIRVAHEAGRTMISVICSDQRAMRAMSEKAQELGQVLEDRLGTRTEVQVDGEREQSRFYQDGRGQNAGGQEQGNRPGSQKKREEAENADFLQQLRLGLI